MENEELRQAITRYVAGSVEKEEFFDSVKALGLDVVKEVIVEERKKLYAEQHEVSAQKLSSLIAFLEVECSEDIFGAGKEGE